MADISATHTFSEDQREVWLREVPEEQAIALFRECATVLLSQPAVVGEPDPILQGVPLKEVGRDG